MADVWLRIWLWNKKISGVFSALSGTPGYLERKYINWCRQNGKTYKFVITIRIVLLINAILAAIVFACFIHTFSKSASPKALSQDSFSIGQRFIV